MSKLYINFFLKRKLIHNQTSNYYRNHSYLFTISSNNPAKDISKSRLDLLYSRNKLKIKKYNSGVYYKEVIYGHELYNNNRQFGNLIYFTKNYPSKYKLKDFNPDQKTKDILEKLDIWNKKSFYRLDL